MKNTLVLITGASSGIGAACAKYFAERGSNLLLCARRLELIQELADELTQKYHVKVHPFTLDVSDSKSVKNILNSLPAEWQAIDVLINNAGLALGLDKFQEGNPEDWDQVIDTNVKGLLYVTRAIIPGMIKRGRGHIINIGSIAGHEAYPGGTVYCASKAAVNLFSRGLKMDLQGTPVRVSSVDPGLVETDFSNVRFKGDQERAKKIYSNTTPLAANDIADAVYYCASRPPHVNIQEMIVFPTVQAAVTQIVRDD